jgi:hypothetical protein
MSEDGSKSLVPRPPSSLSVSSRLAERTLAQRVARSEAVALRGRILLVGRGGYATITEAVAEARDGDTVLVGPGTYRESVTITRAIVLRGAGDRGATIIESEGTPSVVVDHSDAVLDQLTIRGGGSLNRPDPYTDGLDPDVAVAVLGGAPELRSLLIDGYAGVSISDGASPTITACEITPKFPPGGGPGVYFSSGAGGSIIESVISGHNPGIAAWGWGTAPTLLRSTVRDIEGMGFLAFNDATAVIEENRFLRIEETPSAERRS